MVDFPALGKPVNQTTTPRWPCNLSRRSRVTVAWCQTTLGLLVKDVSGE